MEEPAIWREPARGAVVDPAEMLRLSGLEQMRGIRARPAMSLLTGVDLVSAGPGVAVFDLPISPWLQWSSGAIPGGVLALPADGAAGCALQTELAAATSYTTAELSLTYLRPLAVGDRITASGRCLHAGRTVGLSDVELRDQVGRLVAHATSRATIFPPAHDLSGRLGGTVPPERMRTEDADASVTPPWQREVSGEVLDAQALAQSGLSRLRGQISGELDLPPLHHLLGLTPLAADEGVATCGMPATGWLATPWGWPQGGFIALLADAALGMAVETTMSPGARFATVDLKVNFLRPVPGDGALLTATGTVVHRGRTLAVATAEIVDARGKRVAVASGSSALL